LGLSPGGVQLVFIRPGKPGENALIRSFHGRLRGECVNVHQFTSIAEAQAKIGAWRIHYTQLRPQGSLGDLTPNEYARQGPLPPTAEAASVSRNLSRLGTNVNHRDSLLTNCLPTGGAYAVTAGL